MQSIESDKQIIHFNSNGYKKLNTLLAQKQYSIVFVLVDENTHEACLSPFLQLVETTSNIEIIEIESGEAQKNIETCAGIWNALTELNADKKSVLINLGGGVITDIGGFVASTFKRGMDYINVPTSLLAMVDAAIGGKTGVDLGHLKNQIGVINNSEMVLIDTRFLDTLEPNQLRSGLAEMLKHGLIYDREYWLKLTTEPVVDFQLPVYESVVIKQRIVEQDPSEQHLRKTLNFGHTLGHAIESYFLSNPNKPSLLHGEAIAIGMVLACFISTKLTNFPIQDCQHIKEVIKSIYGHVTINTSEYPAIINLLKYDKKNTHGNINFVLLEAIGTPRVDCQVSNSLIEDAFNYYKL
ncbi:3-dehydroquinate synthase [Bizionia sediminis]|uniref:3-dehydroquinate synthase n=1 Tax=Bizionia sediminis TaxID=1737064 RepID=A0ABW5KQ13_9FLAO